MRIAGIVLLLSVTSLSAQTSDVAAARRVFEANLDAIRQKNIDKYLSYYLHSKELVRGGPTGFATGWEDFNKARGPFPEHVDVIDLHGMWVTPGLIDAHVHFSQTGWADGRPDAIDVRKAHPYEQTEAELKAMPERYGRSYLCSGVTAVWDVGGYPWTLKLHDQFENNTQVPHVVAAGPLLSTLDHWLNLPAERQFIVLKDEDSGRNGVRYLAAQGSKAVKVWWIVTKDLPVEKNEPFVTAAADEAHKHNLPLIVHATGLAEAKGALRSGANVLVHSVEDLPIDQEFIDLLKKNNAILIPTLTVLDGYIRMYRGVVDRKAPAIDDPNGCVDPSTRARIAETASVDPALVP